MTKLHWVLYGGNLGNVTSSAAAIGGVAAEVAYAGNLTSANGVAQFNLAIPRSLIGRGSVDAVLTINVKTSNSVNVNIK